MSTSLEPASSEDATVCWKRPLTESSSGWRSAVGGCKMNHLPGTRAEAGEFHEANHRRAIQRSGSCRTNSWDGTSDPSQETERISASSDDRSERCPNAAMMLENLQVFSSQQGREPERVFVGVITARVEPMPPYAHHDVLTGRGHSKEAEARRRAGRA
ncbi:hypothetical protein N658DRAFT_205181 [Parathielavia hyrcaniae]|uniref:Uncharacterized protein n=1 Tax=Parathielavia hyrcaniae TaxID=113614 RepID=A0AAN6PYB1_9PEZI|nr:hypothetical protein N658DRAFT_205181 [Parathielavia hyrcaniae]